MDKSGLAVETAVILDGMDGRRGFACALCDTDIALWEMDTDSGFPAHSWCATAYRAEVAAVLEEAEALVLATTDPRLHRRSAR